MAVEVFAIVRSIQTLSGCGQDAPPDAAGSAAVQSLHRWTLRYFGPQGPEAVALWEQADRKSATS